MKNFLAFILIAGTLISGCKKENINLPGSVFDADGNGYDTVRIGNQTWLSENLKTTKYRDGSSILTNLDDISWSNADEGACTENENIENYVETYGVLYNYFAIIDQRGICPVGWRVPNDYDWVTLINVADSLGDAANILKSTSGWNGAEGTDPLGFSILPSGWRSAIGDYLGIGDGTILWTSSGNPPYYSTGVLLMGNDVEPFLYSSYSPKIGGACRCIKE